MSGQEDQTGLRPCEPADHPRTPGARRDVPRGDRTPGPVSSFIRFVLCGGGVTLLSSWALILLDATMSLVLANALVTALGTLLVNELHGRVSFKSDRRGWRMHGESALTALGAYLVTTGAMLALHHLDTDPAALLEQGVYLVASGVAGTCRFLVLRLVVFGRTDRGRRDGRNTVVLAA
ncbi:GtrA family protein [Actinocorallia populi]|uniref:GtrA family protein n=1 Tax=Actinocorallia populi TaxID=2079200 RepID=UPI000D097864|nr:GtrA family protein [Actinocorallia populi]